MKKFTTSALLAVIILTVFSSKVNAQAVDEGNSIISVGYGFPNLGKSVFKAISAGSDVTIKGIGPIHLKYEYMVGEKIGIGASINIVNFSVNWVDQSMQGYDVNGDPILVSTAYKISSTNYSALFRFNYHFYTDDNLDVYYGLGAGYRGATYKVSSTPYDPDYTFSASGLTIPVGFETTLGMRYFFTEQFGAYTEIGIGKSLIQFGACLKL
jgi:opacity protein-like surface antigen